MIRTINKIIKVFADNGLFDEGVELIGSWCYLMYQEHLGAKKYPLRTQDIDFLIPNPFVGKNHSGFIKQLEDMGFNCDFNSDGSLYLWNSELKIEFITPDKGRGADKAINVKKLELRAIPLRFTAILLEDPIIIEENRVKVLIPNPVNFCLHKLLISSRRKDEGKRLKDLQHSICASVIVNKKELKETFNSFPDGWKKNILKVLKKAEEDLPLLKDETLNLLFTLQNEK